jgi:hypothetical protein
MHDALIVGVPLVTILAGLFFNNAEIKELRGELKDLRLEMNRRFDDIDAELRYFHGVTGELKGRIDTIEKRG